MRSLSSSRVAAGAAASTSSAASENKETTVIEMVMVQTKSLQTVKIEFSDSARPYDPEAAAAEGDAKDDSVTVVPAAVLPAMMQAVKIKEEPRDEDDDVQVVDVKVR